jgi:hypothetical protein
MSVTVQSHDVRVRHKRFHPLRPFIAVGDYCVVLSIAIHDSFIHPLRKEITIIPIPSRCWINLFSSVQKGQKGQKGHEMAFAANRSLRDL